MNHLLLSIPIGLGIGYVAQRSRMCFVGGIRDYILVHDEVLLRGFISFFAAAWLLYSLLFFLGFIDPRFSSLGSGRFFHPPPKLSLLALQFFLSGFGLGFLSILANGCPLRQHILAAQGNLDSLAYLLGFYVAVLFYDFVLSRFAYLVFRFT
jgi:hypothetical protein